MIAHNPDSLCRQAELHYYDFLYESREPIPEPVVNHIEQCQRCQDHINQLKEILSETEGRVEPGQRQISSAVTVMLKLHFAYLDKRVTCQAVRPFLPGQLDPALEIRIPTPITTHLDNCKECSEDLETIRNLNLNRKQLRRLSQLFAEKPAENNVSCPQAQAAILAVVSMVFHETNEEVLKHLCTCPDCCKLLYQYRGTVRKEYLHNKIDRKKFPCEEVSATDIFDYAIPYGIDPSKDEYAKFRKSFISHVATCPNCLAKMQQLHKTVYSIAERAESEVVTIYNIDESAKAKTISESDDIYAGFPIKVDVINRKDETEAEQPVPTINFTGALKQRISAMNLKPLLKPAIAAAAVILIAVTLFVSTPTAKAVTIDQIYKALEKVKNVYISRFAPDKKKPIQEKWVSRTLNNYMTKTGKKLVLWDIPNKVRKVKLLGTDSVETTLLSGEMISKIEETITGSFDLIPFYDTSEIPEDAEWSRVTDDGLEAATRGIEIYDLTWIEKAHDGSDTFKKWRVFVYPETNLPQKTEFYKKLPADSEYTLISVKVVEYLSDSEMQIVLEEASF